MAVQTITYQNKVALNENPSIADINKVTDDDMNEIKDVVNNNAAVTLQNQTQISSFESAETYSTTEVKTNSVWINNKPIYRKVIVSTLNGNENQSIDMGIVSILDTVVKFEGCIYKSGQGSRALNAVYFGSLDWAYQSYVDQNNMFSIQAGSSARGLLNGATLNLIVYYTKTTD